MTDPTPSVPDSADIECEQFYDLMQTYRHTPIVEHKATLSAYEAVKAFIAAFGRTQYERGVNEAIKAGGVVAKSVYDKGFREAIEKAAEIAEQKTHKVERTMAGLHIGCLIRALLPPSEIADIMARKIQEAEKRDLDARVEKALLTAEPFLQDGAKDTK